MHIFPLPQLTPKADIWSIGIMIYEAILCNLHATDLDFFYDLMGEKVHPTHMIGELNNLYKYNKDQWIDERKVRNFTMFNF
jgi:serine/threonine protein kinase